MTGFTIKALVSGHLDDPDLQRGLAPICADPSSAGSGVFAMISDVVFCTDLLNPQVPPPTRVLARLRDGKITTLPWPDVPSYREISQAAEGVKALFTLAWEGPDAPLMPILQKMHDTSGARLTEYTLMIGPGYGALLRQARSSDLMPVRWKMDPERHLSDADIQAHIDKHFRVLIPASASNHHRLLAEERGAALAANVFGINHPKTGAPILPVPVPERHGANA